MTLVGSSLEISPFTFNRKCSQNPKMNLIEYLGIHFVALSEYIQCNNPRLSALCLNQRDDPQKLTEKLLFLVFWVIFKKSMPLLIHHFKVYALLQPGITPKT